MMKSSSTLNTAELPVMEWRYRIGLSQKYDDNQRAIPELRTRRDLIYVIDVDTGANVLMRGAEAVCLTPRGAHFYFSRRPCLAVRSKQDPAFLFNALKRGYWSECLFFPSGLPRTIKLIRGMREVSRYGKPETAVEWHKFRFEQAQRKWIDHVFGGIPIDAHLE